MTICYLTAKEAISELKTCQHLNKRVLGVDGFEQTKEGFIARLDLILDLSDDDITIWHSIQKAQSFILDHADDGIVFEIISE